MFYPLMILCLAISAVCLAAAGPALFTPRSGGVEVMEEGIRSQLLQVGKSFALTSFLFLLCHWRDVRQFRALLFVAGLFVLIGFNPVTAPRFQVVAATIATLATLGSFVNLSSVGKAVLYTVLFMGNYVIFGPLKSLSAGVSNFNLNFFANIFSSLGDYAYRVDFDALQVSSNTVMYLQSEPFNWGYQLFGAVFFFVPRFMWEGKPYSTSIIIHDELGYDYLNLSMPLPMEFYSAGGYPAVIVLALLLGYCIKRWSLLSVIPYLLSGRRTEYTVLVALIAGYAPIIMRGALNAVAPIFGFAFIAFIFIVFVGRRQRIYGTHFPPQSGLASERN